MVKGSDNWHKTLLSDIQNEITRNHSILASGQQSILERLQTTETSLNVGQQSLHARLDASGETLETISKI